MAQTTGEQVKSGASARVKAKAESTPPPLRRAIAASTPASDAPAIDLSCVNTIRTLAMDAVQAANSGHPGTPMALAPVAYTLWQRYLRFDP